MDTATADRALEAATPEALVTAIKVLTHRIHDAGTDDAPALRDQRAAVEAEVLRRMGGTR